MRVITAKKMQQIDKAASKKYGIPSIILMENAAIVSAFCVLQMLKAGQNKVLVLCGGGNNGGDGFACARHLINRKLKVKVFFVGKKERLSQEAKVNYEILRKTGQKILQTKLPSLRKELKSTELIVDALLGIGLKSNLRAPYLGLIRLINSSKKPVLSLDVPSGLDATTGQVRGIAVEANRTITFGLLKKGFLNPQAKKYTGEITVGDISLPRQLLF